MELTWLKNTDEWWKLSFLPFTFPGARIVGLLGPVSHVGHSSAVPCSTVPSCLKF